MKYGLIGTRGRMTKRAEQRFNVALEKQSIHDFSDLERASRSVKQVIYSCQGEHSTKPAEARFRLEQLYGNVLRIELFARRPSEGWDIWGNECDSSVASCE